MKITEQPGKCTGLYVLGSLYPYVTGGMEVFNYYFLNYQLQESADRIIYLGENPTVHSKGHFIVLKKRWPVRFFYPFQFFMAVFKLRKQLNYAYVSYAEQSWIIAYSHSVVLRLFNIPYFITIHWGKEPDWEFPYPFISYFKNARAVIGVSKPVCLAFKKRIPQQDFQYIPPLIPFLRSESSKNDLKTRLGFSREERILLFVGSLKEMKNPGRIIEAFHKLGTDYLEKENIRSIIAGEGNMRNDLKKKIEVYGLDRYIRLEGLVSRQNMPDYYKAADLYIISSDYEGTSVSLLEAMYNQLIIIASNAPGINEMLTHEKNALLYETNDTTILADTIKRGFNDKQLGERLSRQAFDDFNQNYSYDSMIKKYQDIFSSASF
jgi:glycosyltransferase involved in cell wall biosynthesis